MTRGRRPTFAILAEGDFGIVGAKTAVSAIRYLPDRVVAVIDSTRAGRTVEDLLGIGGDVPVVADMEAALATDAPPDALLIGIAPQGGALPDEWRPTLRTAIEAGLDVWSGLHSFLSDDPELSSLADRHGVALRDLRRPPRDLAVARGRAMDTGAFRVLTVGTDCNVGKMTAALELRRELRDRGLRTAFAGTGQTGILIEGRGIAVDAVVSDFVAGAAERVTVEAAADAELVLVEGQGSLLHPGYSGVTLGLLHGAMPQAMVLCHVAGRDHVYKGYDWVDIPPLAEVAALYEEAATWVRPREPGRVVGVCLATYDLSRPEAEREVGRVAAETGLPTTDPIRFGAGPVADALVRAREGALEGRAPVP